MKCCRRYVSQTFAINTFRFAIFSSKKPFLTRVFIHRKFFNHFVNIFVKKTADFLTHGYSVGVFVSHRDHSISISAFFCVLIASSLLCAPGGNRLDQSRTSLVIFHGNLSDRFIPWIYRLLVEIYIVRILQPSLKSNLFLLRFCRTHVTIIIACI